MNVESGGMDPAPGWERDDVRPASPRPPAPQWDFSVYDATAPAAPVDGVPPDVPDWMPADGAGPPAPVGQAPVRRAPSTRPAVSAPPVEGPAARVRPAVPTATARHGGDGADADILVGSVLDAPRLFAEVSYVKATDFREEFHQTAWAAVGMTLRAQGVVTVASIMAIAPKLDAGRLHDVAARAPRSPEACRLAARRLADRRRAMEASAILSLAARDIKQIAEEPMLQMDAGDDVAASSWAARLSEAYRDCIALTASSQVVNASHVEARIRGRKRTPEKPIPTGMACLDEYLRGGMLPGQMIGIAAQSKIGKTTLVTTISHNAELAGIPHLFATLERTGENIEELKMGRRLGCRGFDLKDVPDSEYAALTPMRRVCEYMHKPGATVEDVRSEILYQVVTNGIKLAIIDYLQVLKSRNPKENPDAHITRASQILQQTAIEGGIPIVVTVQNNELGFPMLSGAMKNAANAYFVLQRDRGSADAYLETYASNIGDEVNIGRINAPSLKLVPAGPHFVSVTGP